MPDDNTTNDRLMEKFIESATPKLLEALSGQITEHVEKQIGGLAAHTKELLSDLKKTQAERDALAKERDNQFTQLKTLLERGESPAAIKSILAPEPITLTREQARSTEIYRRAKAQAQAAGTTIQITE